jgi:methylaspartate mutase sigma subunit
MKNRFNVILMGTHSDSHTWNLIFMELFLKENNCDVRNLGACVVLPAVCQEVHELSPDLIIVSSINGHLFQDGIKIIKTLTHYFPQQLPPIVIGGQLGISALDRSFQKKKLLKLGYDGVFVENDSLSQFHQYLNQLQYRKCTKTFKHAL